MVDNYTWPQDLRRMCEQPTPKEFEGFVVLSLPSKRQRDGQRAICRGGPIGSIVDDHGDDRVWVMFKTVDVLEWLDRVDALMSAGDTRGTAV